MTTVFRPEAWDREPADEAEVAARRWVLLNFSEGRNSEQEAAFKQWLTADPSHRAAYERAERVWLGIGYLSHLRGQARIEDLDRFSVSPAPVRALRPVRPRRFGGIGLLACAAAALAVLVAVLLPLLVGGEAGLPDRVATRTAEIREIDLPDGSAITLGARTELSFDFSRGMRRVSLDSGEAFFEVAPDPERPFLVTAGNTTVRVVGTAFEVRRSDDHVTIGVAEGIVETVITEKAKRGAILSDKRSRLQANQQLVASSDGTVDAVRTIAPSLLAPWREGRLYYDGASLNEILFDIGRYYPGEVRLADESLGDLRVTGSYRIDRIEDMIMHMEEILPLRVERLAPDYLVLRKRDPGAG